ncbi:DJ-1/PfpI family protein [Pandoraea sp.]|uniref:GlxA family transcriptional regulator n=1 Tax=Pandoraea sp. TaxID=1883445 RepID=UPI00121EC801|nr:DJ-1/PfpI family protein [Pandoraea sp.]TAL52875.1 MAG: helix-turn-helix domain-containing protein [Pandoraea sp.]TAM19680.1 MAG: helix-turn-helix domain-containing protein [Pandoraea sp.]
MPRTIAFLLFPGFELLDLSGPHTAFQFASNLVPGSYRIDVVSAAGGALASSSGVSVGTSPARGKRPDTLMVPGGSGVRAYAKTAEALRLAQRLAARSRRVTSVCTGAFLMAAAGLLDGRRVTTHWRHAASLQAAYPLLRVEPDRIFIRDGSVWTSAGVSAGIDLALALIEEDLGLDVSRAVAREMVVYHRRPGGQSQFSALLDIEPPSDRIRAVLHFAREHLHEPLPVERLAEVARLSPRQFARAFVSETGQTPAKAVERMRAEAARPRVEDGREPLEMIACASGFGDPERMRRGFIRAFGQPPQALRRLAHARQRSLS